MNEPKYMATYMVTAYRKDGSVYRTPRFPLPFFKQSNAEAWLDMVSKDKDFQYGEVRKWQGEEGREIVKYVGTKQQ